MVRRKTPFDVVGDSSLLLFTNHRSPGLLSKVICKGQPMDIIFHLVLNIGTCCKRFTFGAIENKVKKGALRFCACLNLRLLSFNDPEYRPLQACLNVEMPSSLIFEPLAPACWGVTGHWTVNISRISMDICVVPTNARANRVLARSFSPRILNLRIFRKTNVFLPDYTRMVITSLVIIIFSWIGFSTHKAINPCQFFL